MSEMETKRPNWRRIKREWKKAMRAWRRANPGARIDAKTGRVTPTVTVPTMPLGDDIPAIRLAPGSWSINARM